jgi:hemerythrin-like domain-containing protein
MDDHSRLDRRRFLAIAATSAILVGCGSRGGASVAVTNAADAGEEEVAPAEDLMREHGLLERLLLVYEEAMRRLETPWPEVASAARIVRDFIEDYHERLEEDHLFPRLERAGKEVELVATLRQQHQAGRALTQRIAAIAGAPAVADRGRVAEAIAAFIRMYRPHAAREDTILFPAFRAVISPREYDELGERFEAREHGLFGKEGFAGMVARVAGLERGLGIEDLSRFTPTGA